MGLLLRIHLLLLLVLNCGARATQVGFNWGLKSSHPLPADVVVRLLQDNGITKVKLFEVDPSAMAALAKSGIEVMVGIPNDLLNPLARSVSAAVAWVAYNVSSYISHFGVDIRAVAVGNEPFLETYKDRYAEVVLPALQNVQAALVKAGLGRQVKVTVPLNADVYESSSGLPSGGDFRPDVRSFVVSIAKFLLDTGSPLTINIYPFLSLYADPHFPVDYAFFDGGGAAVLVDGAATYTNVFDANFDTLIWALEKNGLASMPVVVGEIGWPTDGDTSANPVNARRFNQGLLDRVTSGKGTPKRPFSPPQIYLFGLLDEDQKNVDAGPFERHWGVFHYDGGIKYPLKLNGGGDSGSLVPAAGMRYLSRRWCVLSPVASGGESGLGPSVDAACSYSDCSSLLPGSSCSGLDPRSKVSYAFNQYFQAAGQEMGSCAFSNLSVITTTDPSQGNCVFRIMVDVSGPESVVKPPISSSCKRELGTWRAPPSLVAGVAMLPLILLRV